MLGVLLLTASLQAAPQQAAPVTDSSNPAVVKKEESAKPHLIPAERAGALPCDSKDHQAVLLGATTREAILSHRDIYRDNTKHRDIKPEWAARWKAISTPCMLVVAFGSWCSDSQMELPDVLALTKEPNPFVTIHYIGVYRDKKAEASVWPKGIAPEVIKNVPTIWAYELQPGGTQKLLGSIVETAPNGQRMAEAVLDLLTKAN